MPKLKSRSHNHQKKRPTLTLKGPVLTVILAPDREEKLVCARCIELDLVVEMSSEVEALQELLETIRAYAEEFRDDWKLYAHSPNRAHHWPYLQEVLRTKDDWQLKTLLDVRYGVLQV